MPGVTFTTRRRTARNTARAAATRSATASRPTTANTKSFRGSTEERVTYRNPTRSRGPLSSGSATEYEPKMALNGALNRARVRHESATLDNLDARDRRSSGMRASDGDGRTDQLRRRTVRAVAR